MKQKYRAAIIGCGNIGGKHDEEKKISDGVFTHAGAYQRTDEIELVAAADVNERRLKDFGNFWSVKNIYDSHEELLRKETVDILSICTPDNTHFDIIMDVLDTNPPKLIFAEKPLAISISGVREILKKSKDVGTKIVVNYQRRWDADHQKAMKAIKDGKMGDIQAISAYYVKGIQHIGCTVVDTLRFLISDITSVAALPPGDIGTFKEDPSLDAVVFFDNGAKAVIQSCDKKGYTYSIFELDILGSNGRIRIVENGEKIIYFKSDPYHSYPGFTELVQYREEKTEMSRVMAKSMKEILRILDEDLESFTNEGVESYKDSLVIEAILKSKENDWAKVDVRRGEYMDSWILSFSREAGGAEAIAPVVKKLMNKYRVILLAKDYAKNVFTRHSLPFTEITKYSLDLMEELIKKIQKPSLIFTSATSLPWNDMTERYLWKWAEHEGVPSIAVIDQWQNYSLRFSGVEKDEHLKYLPDYICVMDDYAKSQMVSEGIPESRIIVTGQPAFDSIIQYKRNFSSRLRKIRETLGVRNEAEKLILFVSEALYRDFGNSLGYTEVDTLNAVLDTLSKSQFSDCGFKFTLIIKLHPQNKMEDFDNIDFSKYHAINIKFISREMHPRELVLASDVVVGMSSILLVESILMGRPTLSLQINSKKDDDLVATKIGAIPLIRSVEDFEKIFYSMLTDKQYFNDYLYGQNKLCSDGLASERIVQLVDKILNRSI